MSSGVTPGVTQDSDPSQVVESIALASEASRTENPRVASSILALGTISISLSPLQSLAETLVDAGVFFGDDLEELLRIMPIVSFN